VGSTAAVNSSAGTFVSWNWKANGSGSSNTDGSITSTVSANTTAGFSIVSWTGNGASSATIGHGLSTAPEIVVVKNRDATWGWFMYNSYLTNPTTGRLQFDLTNGEIAGGTPGPWNNTAPTATVFSLGNNTFPEVNGNGNNLIAYCFAEVEGYSSFGKYTGNGSTDGPFVYTGFRPAFILWKRINTTSNWVIWDTSRSTYNPVNDALFPDGNFDESTGAAYDIDLLSNGFKLRTSNGTLNGSGDTDIYMALAENPFKNSLAR
jgi:hypothetical protein